MARNVRQMRRHVGVIFQQFNLVGRLSLLTNVVIGALGRIPAWRGALGLFSRDEKLLAMDAMRRVGIAQHAVQRASTLSGGQQQRAAIARALVQQAQLILADEPIASLDPEAARKVMDNLAQINREDRITVVVALHQVQYALAYCPRTVALRAGRIVYDGPSTALTPSFPQGALRRRERRAAAARSRRRAAAAEARAAAAPGARRRLRRWREPCPRRTTETIDVHRQGGWGMKLRLAAAAVVAAGTAFAAGTAAADMAEIKFGIISTELQQNLKSDWLPFLADMEKSTGVKVKAYFAPDYAGIIEGMRFKKVDVAWFGNKSAMEAVDRAGGEIFVQTVDSDGNPGYWSHLIVNKDFAAQDPRGRARRTPRT